TVFTLLNACLPNGSREIVTFRLLALPNDPVSTTAFPNVTTASFAASDSFAPVVVPVPPVPVSPQSTSVFPVSTGSTAAAPIVSVRFAYLPRHNVEFVTPERIEFWISTVWAAPGPSVHESQTTSVGGAVARPAMLMKISELISVASDRPQSIVRLRNVMSSPPITWMPSWCSTGTFARQRIVPPPTTRSCAPNATLTPSASEVVTSSLPMRPVQPDSRCTASSPTRGPAALGVIVTVTESRSTGPLQTHVLSVCVTVFAGVGAAPRSAGAASATRAIAAATPATRVRRRNRRRSSTLATNDQKNDA